MFRANPIQWPIQTAVEPPIIGITGVLTITERASVIPRMCSRMFTIDLQIIREMPLDNDTLSGRIGVLKEYGRVTPRLHHRGVMGGDNVTTWRLIKCLYEWQDKSVTFGQHFVCATHNREIQKQLVAVNG